MAGVALVAAGSVAIGTANAMASNPGSSGGGSSYGGNPYSGSFMPSFQGTQYLMLDGKVRGQDLVIATSNTNRDNRRVR